MLCIFPLITIVWTISFTIKRWLFARKEWAAKRSRASVISLFSRGRATSDYIGREFAHFAWIGEPCKEHSYGKVKGKGVICLTGHIQCKQSLSPRSLDLSGNFQTHRWSYIWEDTENRVISHTQAYYLKAFIHCIYVVNLHFLQSIIFILSNHIQIWSGFQTLMIAVQLHAWMVGPVSME